MRTLAVAVIAAGAALAAPPERAGPEQAEAARQDRPVRAFEVTPERGARHTNTTPRRYRVAGLGSRPVEVALFACQRVWRARGVRFSGEGQARRGSPDAWITELNGRSTSGRPDHINNVEPRARGLRLEVRGNRECVKPVVFRDGSRDGDRNGRLDLRRGGRPREAFGLGGPTRFVRLGRVDLSSPRRCDFLDPAVCLQPWPNDHFTRASARGDTGRTLALRAESMPRNRAGKPIDPSAYNRNDGFSPGQMIATRVPGLTTVRAHARTGAVPITDIGRYRAARQPVVVINARTGARHPVWSEIDSNPERRQDVNLLIRPARNFEEGERYIVALRGLRNRSGEPLEAGRAFKLYRERIITSRPAVERRRPHMESLFRRLSRSGIERGDLYLAWDFTVASERNLTERALHIRDDAFARLGDTNLSDRRVQGDSPGFVVTSQENFVPSEDPHIARRIQGQLVVPCYLDQPGCPPGSRFRFQGRSNRPQRLPLNASANVDFTCNIPHAAVEGGQVRKARPSLYGHGLLGSLDQVSSSYVTVMAAEHNFVFCAVDWAGFSSEDLGNVAATLQDLSLFPTLVDRMQQGFVNFMYLGRAMIHPDGFSSHPAFRFPDGPGTTSVIKRRKLFFDGNSQGGIMGGALTALAPDFQRAVLGVPGMNYSTLLRRSVDFDAFSEAPGVGLYANYPNELERPLILSLIQLLWDRGEANGYAHHMTDDPLPDTPPHEVLLHVAFGDHQVADVTAEVEARTVGARLRKPAADPGRHTSAEPYWNVRPIRNYPFRGSALVVWDTGPVRNVGGEVKGTGPSPTRNVPNRRGEDPHGAPRNEVSARVQKSEFLKVHGRVVDVCGGDPCYADGWTGP